MDASRRIEGAWSEADFVGGHPALDFLNTVADTGKTRNIDKIADWPAVRGWAVGSRLLTDAELWRFLKDESLDGANELAELLGFREVAYAIMLRFTEKKAPDRNAMKTIGQSIRAAIDRGTFDIHDRRFEWRPNAGTNHRWADAAALALEQLVRTDDLAQVRQCARCTWFFIDRGRGAGRRWCDMRTCGNRAKAEAFRNR